MAKRVAVIDIGSNSVRMVVYEKTSRFAFHLLYEEKSKVRISENAYVNGGELQEVPMQRTIDALHDFLLITKSFKTHKILCVATSALRDAPNQKLFLNRVTKELKLNIKVISGTKEAYYGALACVNLLPKEKDAMSIDIGGGSTEIAFMDEDNVVETLSLKLGTVRLKELYFDVNDIDGAVAYIDKELDSILEKRVSRVIGIGGTFRAISNAIMLQREYPLEKLHAFTYEPKVLNNFIEKILKSSEDELKKCSIEENRLDVIKPGALILQRVFKKISFSQVITSGVGVREGVYLSDLLRHSKDKFPHNYNTSVRYILDAHIEDVSFANQLSSLAKKLFDLCSDYFQIDRSYRKSFALAAKLYPAGKSIHFYSQNRHTYYLIETALEYGFTHHEIALIATLTRYAKNKLPSSKHLERYKMLLPQEKTTKQLSYLLSLSIILLSHRPRNIDFTMEFHQGLLTISSKKRLYLAQEGVKKLLCEDNDFKVVFHNS